MSYSCNVKKYGTLVYRPNTDFILAISKLLWEQRKPIVIEPPLENPNSVNTTIDDLNSLNKIIHQQIGKNLEEERMAPFDFNDIKIDDLIAQTDKTLWKAITQSVGESRRSITMDETQTHTKKVRRYFILCCILFCTDARCSRPLHQLITNVVESQGGSALLIKILNRLGVCASADTLSRFVQYKVHTGVLKAMKCKDMKCKDTFMALSVDNIDFRHGFSRVNVGQQIGCWSGTSVQYIEMNPSLEVINPGTEDESELITQTQGQCTVNATSYENREQPIAVGIATRTCTGGI